MSNSGWELQLNGWTVSSTQHGQMYNVLCVVRAAGQGVYSQRDTSTLYVEMLSGWLCSGYSRVENEEDCQLIATTAEDRRQIWQQRRVKSESSAASRHSEPTKPVLTTQRPQVHHCASFLNMACILICTCCEMERMYPYSVAAPPSLVLLGMLDQMKWMDDKVMGLTGLWKIHLLSQQRRDTAHLNNTDTGHSRWTETPQPPSLTFLLMVCVDTEHHQSELSHSYFYLLFFLA